MNLINVENMFLVPKIFCCCVFAEFYLGGLWLDSWLLQSAWQSVFRQLTEPPVSCNTSVRLWYLYSVSLVSESKNVPGYFPHSLF